MGFDGGNPSRDAHVPREAWRVEGDAGKSSHARGPEEMGAAAIQQGPCCHPERNPFASLSAEYLAASLQPHTGHALPPRTPCNAIMAQYKSQLLDLVKVLDPGYPTAKRQVSARQLGCASDESRVDPPPEFCWGDDRLPDLPETLGARSVEDAGTE
jgi:hypothetical protein